MGPSIPRDEEVLAAALRVLADHVHVATQHRLAELVEDRLQRRDPHYAVSGERVRVLTVRSGAVEVTVETRLDGPTPEMEGCPVCRSELEQRFNETLSGGRVATGYRCTWCPWWTGRRLRVPRRYLFSAVLERGGETPGLRWRQDRSTG